MGLSKKYLEMNSATVIFSIEKLAQAIYDEMPEAVFAYLLGSSVQGQVKPFSDLDLALYLSEKPSLAILSKAQKICEAQVGQVRCDIGILNNAEPVYRFEAIKGRLLFAREQEIWLRFYSITCREYETQMYHYEKQRLYRLEVNS